MGASASAAGPKPRQSKLAREHNITAQEEADIKEAFSLFVEPMDGEKDGVIPIGDVRRAMMYSNPLSTPRRLRYVAPARLMNYTNAAAK